MQKLLLAIAVTALTLLPAPMMAADAGKPAMQFDLGGIEYFHRWSQKGQNEFTPEIQADLNHWTDMVTINVYDSVHDGDQLAGAANHVLGRYQAAGKILRTDSKPRTEQRPAEHFVAAVLGSPQFLEAVFARLLLIDGRVGGAVVRSHRIYGDKVGDQMSTWLADNAAKQEKALMNWDKVPQVAALKALPQSTNP